MCHGETIASFPCAISENDGSLALQDASALLDMSEVFKKEKLEEITALKAKLAAKEEANAEMVTLRSELQDVVHKRQVRSTRC